MTLKDLIDVFLKPGELAVVDAQHQIRTILGSCVSITLWHPIKRIGGMSHFLLPTRGGVNSQRELDGRYGDEALALMLQQLAQHGVLPTQCQAKVFGGGNMFPEHGLHDTLKVGHRNGEAARAMLNEQGIGIASESLFGIGHRQIVFDVSNGDVWASQIKPSTCDATFEEKA